jgi:hypothetical protein
MGNPILKLSSLSSLGLCKPGKASRLTLRPVGSYFPGRQIKLQEGVCKLHLLIFRRPICERQPSLSRPRLAESLPLQTAWTRCKSLPPSFVRSKYSMSGMRCTVLILSASRRTFSSRTLEEIHAQQSTACGLTAPVEQLTFNSTDHTLPTESVVL